MSKNYAAFFTIIACFGACAVVWGGQNVMKSQMAEAELKAKAQPSEAIGRFTVAASAQATVLVDTKTGESWFLRPATGGEMEWVAIKVRVMLPPPMPGEKK